MSAFRRWSEDATVGRALIVAGIVVLLIQVAPSGIFAFMTRLWPLAVIAVGAALLLARTPKGA